MAKKELSCPSFPSTKEASVSPEGQQCEASTFGLGNCLLSMFRFCTFVDSYFYAQFKAILELMVSTKTVKDVGTLCGAIVVITLLTRIGIL